MAGEAIGATACSHENQAKPAVNVNDLAEIIAVYTKQP